MESSGRRRSQNCCGWPDLKRAFALGINSAHFEDVGFGDWLEQRQLNGLITGLRFDLRPIYEEADEADPDQWTRIVSLRGPMSEAAPRATTWHH